MGEPLIDVMLVEDDRVFRAGIAELIATEPGMRCTRRYDSVEAALVAPATPSTDVILLDLNLRGMLGSEGVVALRSRFPTAGILMLTVYADEERIFESICNGARGYVLKNTSGARLLEFVRAVHAGGAPMSPEVASKVLRVFRELRPAAPRTDFALTSQSFAWSAYSRRATATRMLPSNFRSASTRSAITCVACTTSSTSTPNPRPSPRR